MAMSKIVACPVCEKLVALQEKKNNSLRLVGFCNCNGVTREVIEMDNFDYVSNEDILEPAPEMAAVKINKRSKK